jgi:hypothetical protein
MTEAKRTMIRASSSEIEQFLSEAAETGAWPMTYDLVSPMHLMSAIRPIMRSVSTAMVLEALDHIAGKGTECRLRPRIKGDGKHEHRIRLRAIRNMSKWVDADPVALLKEYKMPLPPQSGETVGGYISLVGDGGQDEGSPRY